ncbi:SET domain-containing protein-lysine N-methyltransferase [Lewinella sp. JB7]|uniref:SET domain-containing protein n=1 Tax=Lewinella sp. JB7 TaxID=2962887 RepID=UPI0020CA07AF|nr:SET domain-containing protein-lysine N-methyltransferase [Lewinella sp. JB7]
MIHPDTELRFIGDPIGYGVFATAPIPAGTMVYVKDSLELVISPEEYRRHSPQMQEVVEKYSYIDERGNRIVSWDFAKYVNHCCNCNTMSTGYGFEVALRDIAAGEQITDEYGIFNLQYAMPLVCSHANCRGCVGPDDFSRYYREWDRKILQSMTHFTAVAQPLLPLIDPDTRRALDAFLADPRKYRSVLTLKHSD